MTVGEITECPERNISLRKHSLTLNSINYCGKSKIDDIYVY
jgi:hypothetical protein